MRAAAVQLNATADTDRNLEAAERQVRAAATDGAELVALPEKWNLLAEGERLLAGAEPLDGPSLTAAASWATELGIYLLAGSICERTSDPERAANTSVLIGPDGSHLASYRKIHMFDVDVGGVSYRESAHEVAGTEAVVCDAGPLRLGMSVCYDVRFPELYRTLVEAGATALAVPAAFTAATGPAHWNLLVRARAVENECFAIAPNQVGAAPPHFESYGHSLLVGPWGEVLAAADGSSEGFICADLDPGRLADVRGKLPVLGHRRPEAYQVRQVV